MTPFGPAEDIEISIPALREEGDRSTERLLFLSS